ncbi:hypothetical protein [Streptomyces sp. GbtcB6]|uniref:hypothetical protein n=1 Tax=Streptomyces sp. GbtcB6 TaxID=2824751 RepID=UPI001C305E02|nr:hypothetical protein [Streptomyces sp. GbtcB6]
MACDHCNHVLRVLDRYPAGDTRGSLKATHRAEEARQAGQSAAHVHYSPTQDAYLVVIGVQR